MEWLEPWRPEGETSRARESLKRQLAKEVCPGHPMYGLPVELIARGDGDDCLFAILDETNRVAVVHLVWQGPQKPPWPHTEIYNNLEEWRLERMLPEHKEWVEIRQGDGQ